MASAALAPVGTITLTPYALLMNVTGAQECAVAGSGAGRNHVGGASESMILNKFHSALTSELAGIQNAVVFLSMLYTYDR